jgi:hypothetical protein
MDLNLEWLVLLWRRNRRHPRHLLFLSILSTLSRLIRPTAAACLTSAIPLRRFRNDGRLQGPARIVLLKKDDRAMGGRTNFEFACLGRMTTARIAFERSSPQMFPSPVLADTLSHRMGEGRG